MSISVNRLTNANLYVNGINLLGRAEEVNMPDIKMIMSEHKAIGMVGKVEFPSGVDKLEMKVKWNAVYADVAALVNNPYRAIQMMLRGNLETYDSNGRSGETPVILFATAQSKNIPMGNYKQHDNVELETMFSVTSCKMIVSGNVLTEYDALNNTFKVNGVDINAAFHLNTGA